MEDQDRIKYVIKRRANNNQKEVVSFEELITKQFDSEDRVCPKDGKEIWYTFDKFSTLFLQESNLLPPIASVNDFEQEQMESHSPGFVPLDTGQRVEQEEDKQSDVPDQKIESKVSSYRKVIATSAILIASFLIIFLIENFRKTTTKADKTPQTTILMQLEMERLLQDGVRLVSEKGDHSEANIKFSQVASILSTNKRLSADSVKKHSDQFTAMAQDLCSGTKTKAVIELANEYYKHAAILENSISSTCR